MSDPNEAFDEPNLVSLLDSIAPLCRFRYDIAQAQISNCFTSLKNDYTRCLQALERKDVRGMQTILEIESKLAVILYVSGSCVNYMKGIHSILQDQIPIDADISSLFFSLVPLIEVRINHNLGANIPKSKHLDLAVIHFLNNFRMRYLGSAGTGAARAIYSRYLFVFPCRLQA